MKAYLLFAGENYYATGGVNDFKEEFEDREECIKKGFKLLTSSKYEESCDWFQVVDSKTFEIVFKVGAPYGSKDYFED